MISIRVYPTSYRVYYAMIKFCLERSSFHYVTLLGPLHTKDLSRNLIPKGHLINTVPL